MPDEQTTKTLQYIAANIRRLRLRRGLSQQQLAEEADLAVRYVQTLESPRANPRAAVLIALARALNVKPGRLFQPAKPLVRRGGRPAGRYRPQEHV